MSNPLVALKHLEQLYERGFRDPVTDAALLKIASSQATRDEAVLRDLEHDLRELEEQYGLSSDEFYRRWQTGELGDDADYMDWSALYQMATETRARLELLRNVAKAA
jgi:hypothetical protein